jgi:AraC family transcriptional regulator
MEADIHTLYASDFYRVVDFKCRCKDCRTSKPEYSESFCISFVRKGNFLFNVFRNSLDSYNGCVLITKPGYERTVTHVHTIPDECTIIDFKTTFYSALTDQYGSIRFFSDNDIHSTLLKTDPGLEYMHFYLLQLFFSRSGSKLEIDHLVLEIVNSVLNNLTPYEHNEKINMRLKRNHLETIERAKDFMIYNFTRDISLMEIADHCHVSPFHFSRIFKTFTQGSPHHFLLSIRLKHAEMLLKSTTLPVMDVAFSSGFNSIEYFTAAFKNRYKIPPVRFRASVPVE